VLLKRDQPNKFILLLGVRMPKKSFNHQIAYIAVRIAIEKPNNAGTSIGTGFLYQASLNDGTGRTLILLVSNKHVFIDPLGTLRISLNRKNEQGHPDYGNVQDFEDVNFEKSYYEHPDPEVDLACVNVSNISKHELSYMLLNSVFLEDIDYEVVAQGSEVIFVGYPANRFDMVNNLPLVRKGGIASVPDVDFNGRGQIVIDAQVFQGSSGSPVFVDVRGNYRLLGIVSETMIRHSQLQTLPSALLSDLGVNEMLGLGIVIKQRHVSELFVHAVNEFVRIENEGKMVAEALE
jgi:hypothetical protein